MQSTNSMKSSIPLVSEIPRENQPVLTAETMGSLDMATPKKEGGLSLEALESIEISKPAGGKTRGVKRPSPQGSAEKTPGKVLRSPQGMLSPDSLQSPEDAAANYNNRTNAGEVVATYKGAPGLAPAPAAAAAAAAAAGADAAAPRRCELRLYGREGEPSPHVQGRYRSMYTPVAERARELERRLERMGEALKAAGGLEEFAPVGVPRQEAAWTCGRVCLDAAAGRLTAAAVALEGDLRRSGGHRVPLDLSAVPRAALFPGQIVAVRGVNASGQRAVAQQLVEGAPLPPATHAAEALLRYCHGPAGANGQPLVVLVAAGPFTAGTDLAYRPLEDLLAVAARRRPDLLLLCGPFVDEDHPQVAAGAPKLEAEGGAEETVDAHTLFAARVSEKLRAFYAAGGAGAQRTRVALVPSPRDAFHDAAFPQPPFADKVEGGVPNPFYEGDTLGTLDIPFSAGLEKRVHCVPNPATLSLNEVTIGVTSNDVLFDISSNSVMINAGNRMAKLAELLIQQQSYYPVYPPPERMEAKLDLRHAAKWRMPVTPDVLVVPSRLAYFAKNVGGVLCLNPGFLAKGAGAGTYAEVTVHPAPRDQLEKVQPQSKAIPARVAERTVVEIKRI